MKNSASKRLWEIDTLRGFAIISMIFFHFLFDLSFLRIQSLGIYHQLSGTFPHIIGGLFIFIVGISLTLSYEHAKRKLAVNELNRKFIFRGIKIFSLGLLITLISWLYYPPGIIYFGVLHCIGLSIILCYPFLSKNYIYALPLGGFLAVIGFVFRQMTVDHSWFVWLGIRPTQFFTLDYYPLLPWLGIMLLGIFAGNLLYPNGERRFSLPDWSHKAPFFHMQKIGRHSLGIYLVHQPLIVLVLFVYLTFA